MLHFSFILVIQLLNRFNKQDLKLNDRISIFGHPVVRLTKKLIGPIHQGLLYACMCFSHFEILKKETSLNFNI